jgi:hypothetical protein
MGGIGATGRLAAGYGAGGVKSEHLRDLKSLYEALRNVVVKIGL